MIKGHFEVVWIWKGKFTLKWKCSHYLLILMTRESQVMFRSQLNISEASQRDGVLLNNCRKQQENTLDAWLNSSANTDRVCANAFSFAAAVKIWV